MSFTLLDQVLWHADGPQNYFRKHLNPFYTEHGAYKLDKLLTFTDITWILKVVLIGLTEQVDRIGLISVYQQFQPKYYSATLEHKTIVLMWNIAPCGFLVNVGLAAWRPGLELK